MFRRFLRFIKCRLIEICKKLLKKKYSTEKYKEEKPQEPKKKKEKINICQFPLDKVKYLIGWSHGYENLAMKWKAPDFTYEIWDKLADEMAKYVNAIRFFAYIAEDKFYVTHSFIPFPIKNGKYDLTRLDETYISKIKKRLDSFHRRKITTIICLASSIKHHRWATCPFNKKNNINNTTDDVKRFYDDPKTIEAFLKYIENMVKFFDNDYVIWELVNEPTEGNVGSLVKWYKKCISKLVSLGVPYGRIAIEKFDSSRLLEFTDLGIWIFWHGVNSVETLKRFLRSGTEMRELYDTSKSRFCASADGADYKGKARGLIGKGWNIAFRRASSNQMGHMIRYDKIKRGNGVEFMSASAFLDGVYPNLAQSLKVATKGLTRKECKELGVDYNENHRPELKAINGKGLF